MQWNPEHWKFTLALMYSVTGFAAYYFLSHAQGPEQLIRNRLPGMDPQVGRIVLQRTWGFLFLGIIPLLLIISVIKEPLSSFGLGFRFQQPPPPWIYALIPLIVLLSYWRARTPSNLEQYPQIRSMNWTPGILQLSALSWIIFLVGYEFLFRGFLLFASLSILDPWIAVMVNVALYSAAHFYKGAMETFGAIPLGFFLCYITLITGNIWSALLLHTVMALSNEWFSLKAHPHIHLVKK